MHRDCTERETQQFDSTAPTSLRALQKGGGGNVAMMYALHMFMPRPTQPTWPRLAGARCHATFIQTAILTGGIRRHLSSLRQCCNTTNTSAHGMRRRENYTRSHEITRVPIPTPLATLASCAGARRRAGVRAGRLVGRDGGPLPLRYVVRLVYVSSENRPYVQYK